MRTPTKFVAPLTNAQRTQLKQIYKTDSQWRCRQRAHAVLLSDKQFAVNQLADIFEVDRDTISLWLDWWNEYQFDGLADDPRAGRPALLRNEEEKKRP